jgi:hypothetical protein
MSPDAAVTVRYHGELEGSHGVTVLVRVLTVSSNLDVGPRQGRQLEGMHDCFHLRGPVTVVESNLPASNPLCD